MAGSSASSGSTAPGISAGLKLKLPEMGVVRDLEAWDGLLKLVKFAKLVPARCCLSHHMSKARGGKVIESLASIGYAQFQRKQGKSAGGGGEVKKLDLRFPALFAAPEVDRRVFATDERGSVWRYEGKEDYKNQAQCEEETSCEILAYLFAVSPDGVVMETQGKNATNLWGLWDESKVAVLIAQAETAHQELLDTGLVDQRARDLLPHDLCPQ